MKWTRALHLCFCALPLVTCQMACTNQQLYDTIQQNNELECSKLPQGQYEECMSRINQPYDEYERQLEESAQDGEQDR